MNSKFDNAKAWGELKDLIDEAVGNKDQYRYCGPMFCSQIQDDAEDILLDIITKRSDVRKAYRNLRERYNDLNKYITQIQINLFASAEIVSSLMKNGRRNLSPSQEKILANLNQVIDETKYLTRDFGDRHKICQRKLKEIDGGLDHIKDINELKSIYQYLKESFDDLEKFTKIQESQLDACRGHLERYQPNEPIKIVQQTKDDVIPKTSQQASFTSKSNGLSKELKPLDTSNSAVAQKPSTNRQKQTTSSTDDLNTELSEFSDSLNFHRIGSKRSSHGDQIACKKSRVTQNDDVTPKPSKEDLFENLFEKPKEITPPAPKPEAPVRPINPLKPYYDIASLRSRKRHNVGNNIVFPAFYHKRPRMMTQKTNAQNIAYFPYTPQPSGIYIQAYQQNTTPQYIQRPRKQAKRNITPIPNLSTINQQPVVIDLTQRQ